jgi:uncharacterized membrane protein YdbT with pleckstrin-like domain
VKDIIVRPTLKFVRAGYIAALLVIAAGFVVQQQYMPEGPWWMPLVLCVFLIWAISRHIRRRTLKLTLTADKLRSETGMFSKSTRTIQLAKVQDVRVDQSFAQRLLGVGSIAIETAGEGSRLVLADIDQPQTLADEIMRRAELATGTHGV